MTYNPNSLSPLSPDNHCSTNQQTTSPSPDYHITTDLSDNAPLQHYYYIRTKITTAKAPDTFQLYCGNPNGLNLGLTSGDFQEYLQEMDNMSVDLLCLYKINLDTQHHKVKHFLHSLAKKILNHSKLSYSSSAIPTTTWYNPGGTLIMGSTILLAKLLIPATILWAGGHTSP